MSQPVRDMKVFWTCFIALIATSFGFIVRVNLMDTWAKEFQLSETQKGQIFGVGLWPFAISIVLFSLIIDKIGYKISLLIAFLCHAAYMAIIIVTPSIAADPTSATGFDPVKGYWMLYIGSLIGALGNGTVEAVINPVVATMFSRDKTKWLNILHAGWPGGLVLGGVLALSMGNVEDWRMKVGLVGLPVLLYGFLLFGCKFPVNERVTAGVSYRDMLREVGFFGALLVSTLIVLEVSNVMENAGLVFQPDPVTKVNKYDEVVRSFDAPVVGQVEVTLKQAYKYGIAGGIALLFGLYTLSLGRILFVFLMLIMMPLAITELGTDSWIGGLMEPEMKALGKSMGVADLKGEWVLVYTSAIMMVLRFFAGPIVHRLTPLGLLAVSSALAIGGLLFLSAAAGAVILLAATLYGVGKTFFWPTMLGVVAEQFPKGGALTLNAISGLGMMAVGILGAPLLGNVQDKETDKQLAALHAPLHGQIMGEEKTSVFGKYKAIDETKLAAASDESKETVKKTKDEAKKAALKTVAVFPAFMLACYLLLIGYFYLRGGYKPVTLPGQEGGGGHH